LSSSSSVASYDRRNDNKRNSGYDMVHQHIYHSLIL
jgi:hypothetical protein